MGISPGTTGAGPEVELGSRSEEKIARKREEATTCPGIETVSSVF